MIYTSGSTGQPKGVMVEHRSAVNFLRSMTDTPGLAPEDTVLAITTIAFDIAGLEVWLPLSLGARVVLASRIQALEPTQLMTLLQENDVTMLQATPATWQMLLNNQWAGNGRLRALCGGEALTRDLAETLIDHVGSLWNMYGPTESTIWSACRRVVPCQQLGAVEGIGHPIANTQIYVLDRHGEPVPLGVAGELHIGGAGVARGYLNRPELTAERFIADPFGSDPQGRLYKTGDLGRYRADGTLEYLGRNDFQVKIRGFRIELGEIESRLRGCAGVREAVVLAREDQPGDKRLVAYVVADDGMELSSASLREQLLRELAEYMVPSAYVVLEQLPLTPNGKLDRAALPAPDASAVVSRVYEAPVGEVEQAIAQVWQELLGLERVGRHDHFFELGGHSLLVVRMMHSIKQRTGRCPAVGVIFRAPTVAQFASEIASGSDLPALVVPFRSKGDGVPLFCIHPAGGQVGMYRDLAQQMDEGFRIFGIQSAEAAGIPIHPESVNSMVRAYCDAIRERQPLGPYRLLGWSTGAIFATAIASVLEEQGETVQYLGVLDFAADPIGFRATTGEAWGAAGLLVLSGVMGRQISNSDALEVASLLRDHGVAIEQLFGEGISEYLNLFMQSRGLSRLAPEELEFLRRLHHTTESHLTLIATHKPTPTRIRPHVVCCAESQQAGVVVPAFDKERGISVVPGDHYSMLRPPQVEVLGQGLSRALNALNARQGSEREPLQGGSAE
ncbi:non-ribosomal peptide synthetase [Pseudoxanthomonas mexicana]